MKNVLLSAREFVPFWAAQKGIKVKGNGIIEGIYMPTSFATLWLDYTEYCNVEDSGAMDVPNFDSVTGKKIKKPKLKRIAEKDLEKAWAEYPAIVRDQVRQVALDKALPFKAENTELDKWLAAVSGETLELDLAVMRHVLWQVKRKALKLPVVHHLCPIFFGKQGGGKTTAIRKLLRPIDDFILEFDPDEVTDPRNAQSLNDNLVCFFDEMANMAKVEMESIKKLITTDYLTYRPMYTNTVIKVGQNCSFIGGSNKSMSEIIYDPTGMRRFYEITCLDKSDFDGVNSVNYELLWSGIDADKDRGYIEPYLIHLTAHQAGHQTEDEIQHFLREQNVLGGADVVEIPAGELYNHFALWRGVSGYAARQAPALNSFCMKLSTHKLKKRVKAVEGKNKTVYSVNKASHIFEGPLLVSAKMLTFNKGGNV